MTLKIIKTETKVAQGRAEMKMSMRTKDCQIVSFGMGFDEELDEGKRKLVLEGRETGII